MRPWWLCMLAACGRVGFDTEPGFSVSHVPAVPGDADLLITASIVIDTTDDQFPLTLTTGATYEVLPQDDGPDVNVLRVRSLVVASGVVVRVVGTRPFAIVAVEVTLDGLIDAGARTTTPGAGGSGPRLGPGFGADATSINAGEGGGGGGGFATAGSRGGNSTEPVPGAAGGGAYGDAAQTVLLAGSGAGSGKEPPNCAVLEGGAGGGAIQISATSTITIGATGGIHVGGGGGAGGSSCLTNAGAGSGGGSGGAVFLEASTIANGGLIAANGGAAGGGGANDFRGIDGEDGLFDVAAAKPGGEMFDGVERLGCPGGIGGHQSEPPGPTDDTCLNAGGGGGAFGRILFAGAVDLVGQTSPAASIRAH